MIKFRRLSLFGWSSGSFPVPVEIWSAAARSRGQGRPKGRRATRLALDPDEHGRTLAWTEANGRRSRVVRAPAALSLLLGLLVAGAPAAAGEPKSIVVADPGVNGDISEAVREAARRFGIPEPWIYAVMREESGGQASAVSPTGAMGLLQLMPATWRELRTELGLGDDPFDPRDNVIAGVAYMRRMYDQFGAPGFLAAYNAGPARYARHLAVGAPLPAETRNYVARLAPKMVVTAHQSPDLQGQEVHGQTLFVSVGGAFEEVDRRAPGQGFWP